MIEAATNKRQRLAVVLSHPTQYFSPWFQHIAGQTNIELKVFYLWDFGVENKMDLSFGHTLKWDIPLLEGYASEFIPNISREPGTHHFFGLNNPGLVSAMRAWKPDAILMFGYNYLSHLRVMLSWSLRKVPMLQRGDSHDLSRTSGWKSKLKRYLRSLIFKRFAAFLSVGKANADYLRNSGVSESRIHFAPHCIDNQRFQSAGSQAEADAKLWRKELGIPTDARVILFAGKFETKKCPLDLLQAFLKMPNEPLLSGSAKTILLFVGAGVLEAKLRDLAAELIGKTVFFAPFQNQTQMPKVYACCDVLVLPSQGEGETWGLAINEAMNLARPAIVSSHVGCGPDLVLNGKTGWIFSAGCVDELVTILQQAITMDASDLSGMGQAAFERVQLYSYGHASQALEQTLNAISLQKISGK